MEADLTTGSLETPEDIGTGKQADYRRWMLELSIANKQEKDWRRDVRNILERYRSEEKNRKRGAFNILYSNTDLLAPAIYNSQPIPDVRRRFKDADPLGKQVSEMLQRCLSFSIDCDGFDSAVRLDVLDCLLPGRGVSRVRYVPSLVQVGEQSPDGTIDPDAEDYTSVDHHEMEQGESQEELAWEQALIEHVNWDDFRVGPGRTWDEITWMAFRHRMTRDQLVDKFGEIGWKVNLSDVEKTEQQKSGLAVGDPLEDIYKHAEVWEFWDKQERQVIFVADGYRDGPLKTLEDPLRLSGFFPVPRPLYFVQDSSSLVPIPPYRQYEEQADELGRISRRINNIIDACKVRGIYDGRLTEISELMRGDDNDYIPATNAAALQERGGLESAIWTMPLDMIINVLSGLYNQREQCKQVIAEITGISDLLRGSTDPTETATAQGIKQTWGTLRLQRMQKEVQRYTRDLIRMVAELIGEHFQPETLMEMSNMHLPSKADLAQAMQQYQMQMQAFQHQQMVQQQQAQYLQSIGQQPPPPQQAQPPQPPFDPKSPPITIDDVMQVLRSDSMRSYKIDIETDSTIADSIESDMEGLQQVVTAVTQMIEAWAPAVQQGWMPLEALKEMVMAVVRRAKLGSAIEDALEKIKQPPPAGPNPEMQKAQMQQQSDQQKLQGQMQLEDKKLQVQQQSDQQELQQQAVLGKMKLENEKAIALFQQQVQAQQAEQETRLESERNALQSRMEQALEQMRIQADMAKADQANQFALLMGAIKAKTTLEVAEMSNQTTLDAAQISAARAGASE